MAYWWTVPPVVNMMAFLSVEGLGLAMGVAVYTYRRNKKAPGCTAGKPVIKGSSEKSQQTWWGRWFWRRVPTSQSAGDEIPAAELDAPRVPFVSVWGGWSRPGSACTGEWAGKGKEVVEPPVTRLTRPKLAQTQVPIFYFYLFLVSHF
jgi:hypothetical protein